MVRRIQILETGSRQQAAQRAFDKEQLGMLQKFSNGHTDLLGICALLEHIADTLLAEPNTLKCEGVARNLLPILNKAYRYEEDILFPWLTKTYGDNTVLGKSLTRLYFEHLEDEAYAGEVVEMLQLICAQKQFEAETAGYMFRGFFEGLRRHVAFEQDYLYQFISSQNPNGHSA